MCIYNYWRKTVKKHLLFLVFGIIFGNNIFTQDDYLNFRWGMSPNEVYNLLDNNDKEGWGREGATIYDPVVHMMFYLHSTEIRDTFNGRLRTYQDFYYIDGRREYRYTVFSNNRWNNLGDGGFRFFFANNRLIGVQTIFIDANIVIDLEARHSRGTVINLSGGGSNTEGRVWLNNERFIIWINDTDTRCRHREYVAYMDSASIRRICQSSIEENRKLLQEEQQRIRSRLDYLS